MGYAMVVAHGRPGKCGEQFAQTGFWCKINAIKFIQGEDNGCN
jgi:hypothetical protein